MCGVFAAAILAAAAEPRSVWDGVYVAEQASRGEKLAAQRCVACHGDRLTGGELAPALTGDVFSANWDGVKLSDLADRIRTTMPQDRPGTLSRAQSADIIAYILSLAKMPAGDAPLAGDAGVLGEITFESIKPQR
ncbi:MAG: cytochrome c [Acidobacteria bacterium]|nr:cytochrome c [Acidobacteriota bacterium]